MARSKARLSSLLSSPPLSLFFKRLTTSILDHISGLLITHSFHNLHTNLKRSFTSKLVAPSLSRVANHRILVNSSLGMERIGEAAALYSVSTRWRAVTLCVKVVISVERRSAWDLNRARSSCCACPL
ncbi:hypothetical protein CC2G_003516 [Coprinopsis cinerea AmutBmut pab1-1]|nr:hypothetical protein CC2G_003516 [Coprinopsis cinerea AmutBmut pab1-1]